MFSWIGGLERKFDKPKHLEERMKTVITKNDGWVAKDDSNKLGYTATKAGAMFEMGFKNLNSSIQTINLFVMRSYGDKWEGSKIRVNTLVTRGGSSNRIEGSTVHDLKKSTEVKRFHDNKTSETYTFQLVLGQGAMKNDDLAVKIELVGGSTFKIMGMAFCDH